MFKNTDYFKTISFFLLSLSIFTYQNLLGPTFSTLLTGLWQAWVAIPSFLGIGIGLWLSVTLLEKRYSFDKTERIVTHIIFYSFILVFLGLHFLSYKMDQEMLSIASTIEHVNIIEKLTAPILINYVPILLFIVSIPFILFGVLLACQFSRPQQAVQAYRIELLGIVCGSLLCIWLLEGQSWSAVVKSLVGLSFAAILFYELKLINMKKMNLIVVVGALALFIAFISYASYWQLQRNLNLVTRDFHQREHVEELATRWKSFAKVQLLESTQGLRHHRLIAIGDGTGIATYFPYNIQRKEIYDLLTVNLATSANPKKVAVLFAGAGAELLGLHKKLGPQVKTWGVEINSAIPELVAKAEGENWIDFFKTYDSRYVIADNRRFLETSSEKFDSIIYSWSGATIANFSGAILHTTQYSFTIQALQAALKRLESNGTLIIVGGNKLNIIKNLKLLESDGSIQNVKNKILLLSPWADVAWKNSWDDYILIYKNQDWTSDQVIAITKSAEGLASLTVQPGVPSPSALPYQKLLVSDDVETFSQNLWLQEKIRPTSATDDYPFAYRNYPSFFAQDHFYFSSMVSNSLTRPHYSAMDGIIWIGWIFLFLFLISLVKKDVSMSPALFQFLAWAPLSSSCLLLFLYKAILYFGDPSIAFIIVQVAIQIGSLLGLKWARKNKKVMVVNIAFLVALLLITGIVYGLENQSISSFLFHLNLTTAQILFFFFMGITSCLLSFFFLSKLFENTELGSKSFILSWTFETLFTGLISLCGAFLIEEQGLKFFILTSIIFSACLLLLGRGLRRLKT